VTVEVFGIRHHGPGSARSLVAALTEYQPDAVLIEGPADADPLLRWVLADGMTPPLALLAYAPDRPQTAAFWPYAVFSPEWQAMIYAVRRDIDVGFCDLPAASMLARWSLRPPQADDLDEPEGVTDETPSAPPGGGCRLRRPGAVVGRPCGVPAGFLIALPDDHRRDGGTADDHGAGES